MSNEPQTVDSLPGVPAVTHVGFDNPPRLAKEARSGPPDCDAQHQNVQPVPLLRSGVVLVYGEAIKWRGYLTF